MNKEQEGAIDKNLETLVNAFHHNLDCFVSDLRIAKVINADQRDKFRKYDTTREKLIDLFDLLRTTDSGWNLILVHLTHSNQLSLAETLKAAAGETVNIHTPSEDDIWNNENFYNNHQQLADKIGATDGDLKLAPIESNESRVKAEFNQLLMYRNFSKPKGLVLIISNREFHDPKNWPTRLGTDVDARNLAKLWEKLGYSVNVVENLTAPEMLEKMATFAKDDRHHQCDSAVVALLSHGKPGAIVGIDGNLVAIDHMISCIDAKNCPALRNKPKLVIIQACRGVKDDKGQPAETDGISVISTESLDEEVLPDWITLETDGDGQHWNRIPTNSDILIAYATTPGFYSWRDKVRGSWFIQALCLVFEKFAHKEHVGDLLVMVNQQVADVFCKFSKSKQIPEPNTRLRKKFFIYPGVTC